MAAAFACLAAPICAHAETPPSPPTADDVVIPNDPALAAELKSLIAGKNYSDAAHLLAAHPDVAASEDGYRLHVRLLIAARHEDKALSLLESHLALHPNDGWSRFEIAEIQYSHGHGGPASQQYRLALAGDLGAHEAGDAKLHLSDLSQPQNWRFTLGANLSANTSADGALDDGRSYLVGLPVLLKSQDTSQAAFTFSGNARAEKFTALSDGFGLRTTLLAGATTGPAASYDSEALSAEFGPEWTIGAMAHVSVTARALMQWVSGNAAVSGGGLAIHGDTYGNNVLWAGQLSVDDLSVRYPTTGSALNARFTFRRNRYLSASSYWSISGDLARSGVSLFSSPYSSGQVRLGRLFKTPWSSTVYVESASRLRVYDHDDLQTSARRSDLFQEISFRFSKRDVVFRRSVPFVTLAAARNFSNISAYQYTRLKVDVGITRGF